MVTQYGMTERLGAIKLGESNSEPFLGRDLGHSRNYSEEVAATVDEETKKLLANAHQEAFDILEENRDVLDSLVLELMDKETLDKAEVASVFESLRRRSPRPAWTGSPDRKASSIPPVEIPQAIRDRMIGGNGTVNGTDNGSENGPDKSSGNGKGSDSDSGAILTPPGPGGDVHGGPIGPEPSAPEPPA
jgi:cell division protease FtsH